MRSVAFCAHSVRIMSLHGLLRRTFRPRGIWREPTLRPKMAAGAPQRPPLTSWRSFPEAARWRPCRIFVAGVDGVVRRLTRALYMYMHIDKYVCIYIYYSWKLHANKNFTPNLGARLERAGYLAWRATQPCLGQHIQGAGSMTVGAALCT